MSKLRGIGFLATALVIGSAAPAHAAVVIGQAPPISGSPVTCAITGVQISTTAGPDYRVPPGGGVITEWRHQGGPSAGTGGLIVVADNIDGLHATTVALSDERTLATNQLNTFDIRIPVGGGERIGLYRASGLPACYYDTLSSTDLHIQTAGVPPVGTSPPYGAPTTGRMNIAAVLEPDADKDKFGDETQDSCPVESSIQVPCAAVIDRGPKKKTKSRKATFLFSVPAGSGISFECSLDKNEFAPCESPHKLTKLKVRKHRFQVRAKDANGNLGTVDVHRWRVVG